MYFKQIKITEWQQFQSINIDFHERLTVLTGANCSGKTTILNLLATHFDWAYNSLATPKKEKLTGFMKFLTRLYKGKDKSQENIIGKLSYENNQEASLKISSQNVVQYQIQIQNKQQVKCFYIPSHRSIFRYQQISNIPIVKKNKIAAFQEVSNSTKNRYFGGSGKSSSFFMKNTLISWAILGYGVTGKNKSIMPKDPELAGYYEGFQKVLKNILPKSLGFEEFEIRNMEIVFICNDGNDEFIFENTSGGISALIDIVWQIYMYSTKENQDFTVIIDEIENHLHPTMQRQILPDLLKAFPNARFIVATHSPLIVSSVKNSNIYVLKYNNENKVESEKLDFENRAKTAAEILDEVLGVSFTMPIWVEDFLKLTIENYSRKKMTDNDFKKMRDELARVGLERLMPNAIKGVLEGKND